MKHDQTSVKNQQKSLHKKGGVPPRNLTYPSPPKSSKYLVSLKALSGGVCGSKNLCTHKVFGRLGIDTKNGHIQSRINVGFQGVISYKIRGLHPFRVTAMTIPCNVGMPNKGGPTLFSNTCLRSPEHRSAQSIQPVHDGNSEDLHHCPLAGIAIETLDDSSPAEITSVPQPSVGR